MRILLLLPITSVSSLAFIGQFVTVFAPNKTLKLGFAENENNIDPVFISALRGKAIWDVLTLWTLPCAGVLMLFNHPLWIPFCLIGGILFVCFASRGIIMRVVNQKRGVSIGSFGKLCISYLFLGFWGCIGFLAILCTLPELIHT